MSILTQDSLAHQPSSISFVPAQLQGTGLLAWPHLLPACHLVRQ